MGPAAPGNGWAVGASRAAGWRGAPVAATVAGFRVVAVVSVDEAEDRRRRAAGLLPAADPLMLDCLLSTGALDGGRPVTAAGFLIWARSWRRGAAAAAGVSAFGAALVVVPVEPGAEALLDADLSGVGLAVREADGVRLLVAPARHVPPRWTRMQLLVSEQLYAAVTAAQG